MSRAANRLRFLGGAARSAFRRRPRARPERPERILVLHELLLGDTVMLAPLLAALRARYPAASLYVTAKPEHAILFAGKPYGARVIGYSERLPDAPAQLSAAAGCDIAFLPGESRHALAARALGAKWIVGFGGARPGWKDRALDERIEFSPRPMALADMFATLAGHEGGLRFRRGEWPAPPGAPFDRPPGPYAVLHVGAGSPLRLWLPEKWRALAGALRARGLAVAWSAGKSEKGLIDAIGPASGDAAFAGTLDLAQLWRLLSGAAMLVSLDTGVSHLAKLAGTPTAVLYGPGSPALFGPGEFWRDWPFRAVTIEGWRCRDQRTLFKRELAWVRRCQRTLAECPAPSCMHALEVRMVLEAVEALGAR
jgi:ADP-heptose:LPS heptosyltransferase